MNTFIKIIGFLAIGSALALAEEYKTLLRNNSDVTVNVIPTDLVEIVGHSEYPLGYVSYSIQFEDNIWSDGSYASGNAKGTKFTGIKAIKLCGNLKGWITIKITHTEELSKVGPTSVLVIPENSTGNYDVVVESSGDMTTWSPFVSQAVQSDAAKNFFRVRIVKK